MEGDALPRVGGHADGPAAAVDGRSVDETVRGPTPVFERVGERIRVDGQVGLGLSTGREAQRDRAHGQTAKRSWNAHGLSINSRQETRAGRLTPEVEL